MITQTPYEAALSYASRGWLVLPMHSITEDGRCSCGALTDYFDFGNLPKHAMGKHPYTEHGHKDASKSHAQIHLWWRMYPDANVAIRTGKESGLIVLDLDAKNDGYRSLTWLLNEHGPLPRTPVVQSGGGGKHYYFKHPGFEIRGRRDMRPGIDVMADGGKIVAPPSRHKSGNSYHWDIELNPDTVPLAPLPRWLLYMIKTPNAVQKRRPTIRGWM